MTRQEAFEEFYAEQHSVDVTTLAQGRFNTRDGYRLLAHAKAYRAFCAGWEKAQILAQSQNITLEPRL